MRLSGLLQEYAEYVKLEIAGITAERYLTDVRLFAIYVRDCDLANVSPEDIVGYLTLLGKMGLKHNGIVTKSKALRSFWRWMNRMGKDTFSFEAIPNMHKDAVMPRAIPEADYLKVLASIPNDRRYFRPRDRALIMLLHDTGARVGEIAGLCIPDLDLKTMKARIKTEKAKGSRSRYPFREIFWTEQSNAALNDWLRARERIAERKHLNDPEAVFIGSGNHFVGKRMSGNAIAGMLRNYCDRAGVPHWNPHAFRHRFGHYLAGEKNCNNSIIAGLMGHANLQSSQVYTELNHEERERAYDKYVREVDDKV